MNKVYPITAASGLEALVGHFVKYNGNNVVAVAAAATDVTIGVIDHALSDTTGALAINGARTRVKVSGAVKQFGFGKLKDGGQVEAYAGTGRVVCQFLQDGADGETVNATVLINNQPVA